MKHRFQIFLHVEAEVPTVTSKSEVLRVVNLIVIMMLCSEEDKTKEYSSNISIVDENENVLVNTILINELIV